MVRIEHAMVGAYHVLTSPDVPGLYVADRDRAAAEAKVRPTIDALANMAARRAGGDRLRQGPVER